jgi:hypothetical protein
MKCVVKYIVYDAIFSDLYISFILNFFFLQVHRFLNQSRFIQSKDSD